MGDVKLNSSSGLLQIVNCWVNDFSYVSEKKGLDNIFQNLFDITDLNKPVRGLKSILEREEILSKSPIPPGIPILVNGAPSFEGKVSYNDPYTTDNPFFKRLLDLSVDSISKKGMRDFWFLPVQPFSYFVTVEKGEISEFYFPDDFSRNIEDIKYGRHTSFSSTLFSEKDIFKILQSNPSSYLEEIETYGRKGFLDFKKKEASVNRSLLALKIGNMINNDLIKSRIKDYNLKGVPIFMESTSISYKIIKEIETIFSIPFHRIGERFENTGGMCDPNALGKLCGFLSNSSFNFGHKSKKKEVIEYLSEGDFPFLLLENFRNGTNIHNLAREYYDPKGINYAEEFCKKHNVGFQRIEARVVELLSNEHIMFDGFRSFNQDYSSWLNFLKGKKIRTFDMKNKFYFSGDFRGSMFCSPTMPRIDKKWLKNYKEGFVDIGCPIEAMISKLPKSIFKKILISESLKRGFPPKRYDSDFESISAIRGSFLHNVTLRGRRGLYHTNTLSIANIEPISSEKYCEIPFFKEIENGELKFSVSGSADSILIIEKGDLIDLLVIDTKTNRVTPYPEHGATLQAFFYGVLAKDYMKNLGIKVENIHTVLNKTAFYKNENNFPQGVFRPQKFSPIISFQKEHFLYSAILDICEKYVSEMKKCVEEDYRIKILRDMTSKKRCDKCYEDKKMICSAIQDYHFKSLF